MSNSDDNAFPLIGVDNGLTKREYCAGLAMASRAASTVDKMSSPELQAEIAVTMADSLLTELEK